MKRLRVEDVKVSGIIRSGIRLSTGCPQVPCATVNQELLPFREALPIWSMRDHIVNMINRKQMVLVSGDTGSGKTTQIPQFILEHHASVKKACRIICAQPNNISAVSVSNRVASERNENIGQSVGCHTLRESRGSPGTVLTYCTYEMLIWALMAGDSTLATVTHIVVDDIQEQNRFSDLLLIALRDSVTKFPLLRVILISATSNIPMFTKYFNSCPVIVVPGRQYDVQEYFLEDILKRTKYMSYAMKKLKAESELRKMQRLELEKWTTCRTGGVRREPVRRSQQRAIQTPVFFQQTESILSDEKEQEAQLVVEVDRCIAEAWLSGSEDAFTQLLQLLLSENVSVDYQHSQTSLSPLMVAAGRGCVNTAEQLLILGADLNIRASNDWTALEWARSMNQNDVMELIEAYMKAESRNSPDLLLTNGTKIAEEDKELLDIYHRSLNDDNIDIDLLMTILHEAHSSQREGAIFVFLSGYEDIVALRERIAAEKERLTAARRFKLYSLHSIVETQDMMSVFDPAPPGVRKIFLATNIADTSFTIDDVICVIDSGKVKEESYDAISGACMLRLSWISRACSERRKGRAGHTRPGICYHLFSRAQYRALQQYHTPEIQRMPLQVLCLHTKCLATAYTPVGDFIGRAINPPLPEALTNAMQLLKTIDALDSSEGLTELGHHLLNLHVEPQHGKMLMCSVVLKCLDPVLTIVCFLATGDPFILPAQPSLKRASYFSRKQFSAGQYSDHMALLHAFKTWEVARKSDLERMFCENRFISTATMELVHLMKTQLLWYIKKSNFIRSRHSGDFHDLNSNSENSAVVKAALCAGMYPNLIRVDREHMQLKTKKEVTVMFHPLSTLRECPKSPRTSVASSHSAVVETLPSDWLIYQEISGSGQFCHARCCTVVSPITVVLFAGPARMPHRVFQATRNWCCGGGAAESESCRPNGQNTILELDEWMLFHGDTAHLALELRKKWHSLFLRRMRAPADRWSEVDSAVVNELISLVTAQERALGLQQPQEIDWRCPLPLTRQ